MVQNEVDVLSSAQAILEQKQYQKLRNFIWSNHGLCQTDHVKVQLLHLWEDSLYQEFIDNRSPNLANGASPTDVKAVLSSSMRYKLRKKHPCPIELEQELRVKNARLPKPVHDGLNDWLKKHTENPYPNKVEKEALASKLGITPQQVNRWFIQRRKMLRIRGHLYLGRQYETQKGKENAANGSDHGDDYDEDLMIDEEEMADDSLSRHSDDSSMAAYNSHHSLLEKILTRPNESESPSNMSQQMMTHCSGGTVEVMSTKLALLAAAEQHMLPTPPPSVSGERATPPEDLSAADQALDLSAKAQPITLEHVSPAWRRALDEEAADQEETSSSSRCYDLSVREKMTARYRQQSCAAAMAAAEADLDEEERIAVTALLSLGRCK